jgi:putative lipoic acid-binding regulatory protein
MPQSYEDRAKSLEGLPRAERFEALMAFPAQHLIKTIGRGETLRQDLERALASVGFSDVALSERQSSGGKYSAFSFHLAVTSGAQLDGVYAALEGVAGLTHLF